MNKFSKRDEIFVINKLELVHEVQEVFEGSAEVRFCLECRDMHEVRMVYMSVNPKEPLEHHFYLVSEVAGERNTSLS